MVKIGCLYCLYTLLDTIVGNTGGELITQIAIESGLVDLWRALTGEAFDNIAEGLK